MDCDAGPATRWHRWARHGHHQAITIRPSGHFLRGRSCSNVTAYAQVTSVRSGLVYCSVPPLLVRAFLARGQVGLELADEKGRRRERMPQEQEIVRCPYCVLGNEFRPMFQSSSRTPSQRTSPTTFQRSKKFFCVSCGHTATPDEHYSKCACPKCQEMDQLASRCRSAEEMRRAEGNLLGRV